MVEEEPDRALCNWIADAARWEKIGPVLQKIGLFERYHRPASGPYVSFRQGCMTQFRVI